MQAARGTSLTDEQRIEPRSNGRGTRREVIVLFCVAAAVAVLDQASKAAVVATMPGREAVHVLGEFLEITYTRNPGAAFSLGTGFTVALSLIAFAVVALIVRMSTKLSSVGWAIALGGILGGAVGNLIDRLVRSPGPLRGYVVDWISIPHWPVFNIADSAIVCSAALMVVLSLRGVGLTGKGGQ